MVQQGGAYRHPDIGHLQWVILTALATGQYDLKEDSKGIVYFICWWKLDAETLRRVMAEEITKPADTLTGPHIYGVECVARAGHGQEMTHTIKGLYRSGAPSINWHRRTKDVRIVSFSKEI